MSNPQNKYKLTKPGYWVDPEPGFPRQVWWKVVAGPPKAKLGVLQEYDLVFSTLDGKYLHAL